MARTKGPAGEARGDEPRAVPASLEIVYVRPESLNPAPYNPRKATEKDVADLRENIRRFGWVEPLVVNRYPGRENVIIGGHLRQRIAIEDGIETVPIVYVSLPEERERELNVRLNRNVGRWDWDLLANFDNDFLLDVGFEEWELGLTERDLPRADERPENESYPGVTVVLKVPATTWPRFQKRLDEIRAEFPFDDVSIV